MCQTSSRKKFTRLKSNLIVYKILRDDLSSSFKHFQYELGKKYTMRKCKIKKGMIELSNYFYDSSGYYNIHEGFHSFINKPDYVGHYHRIVECTIPKGSLVNHGEDGSGKLTVVSNKIIINKVLN